MTPPDPDGSVLLLGDVPGLSRHLMAALELEGYRVRLIQLSDRTGPADVNRFQVDPTGPESVAELLNWLRTQDGENSVSAIVSLLGMDESAGGSMTEQLFVLLQALHTEYRPADGQGTRLLLNVLCLDGRLGMSGTLDLDDDRVGSLGLCKTVGREHPEIHDLSLDLGTTLTADARLAAIVDAVTSPSELNEVGVDEAGRWAIRMDPVKTQPNPVETVCGPDSVVLVTGGGDGVTAAITRRLAQEGPTLIIVGRTPRPDASSQPYHGLDERSLRQRLIREAAGGRIVPAEIERRVHRILKQDRIEQNLAYYQKLGATVEYHAVDVSRSDEFSALIGDIYARYGRLDGVLHGAGVVQDKLLADKTLDSFRLVYSTKVDSARILARHLRPESLKFLVFFSSIAGRFGNPAQVDYSAANEYLNKLGNRLNREWPARVVSIEWGPWDGGMVNDFVHQVFADRGIRLIPEDEGVECLMNELLHPPCSTGEVLISRSVDRISVIS